MRRLLVSMTAAGLVASGVVFVAGGTEVARAATGCVFEPSSGILTITGDDDVTIARTPDPGGRFQVSWSALAEPTDCATGGTAATVRNVDTVEVRSADAAAFTFTLDMANGPFAPGKKWETPGGESPEYRDLFRPGQRDDDVPEIEFDVHVPVGVGNPIGLPVAPGVTVVVLGSNGPDHFTFGSRPCPIVDDPLCRDLNANLNAGADADADLRVTFGESNEGGGRVTGATSPPAVRAVEVEARGGGDVVSARGGAGTGDTLAPSHTYRRPDTDEGAWSTGALFADGGPGNDFILGGLSQDLLEGGPGDDLLDGENGPAVRDSTGRIWFTETLRGGPGDDTLIGGPGDDVLDGGPGNDLFDEGLESNGADAIVGGRPGHNVVDYSKRSRTVTVEKPGADGLRVAGTSNENDTLDADVDEVRFPADTPEAPGGLHVLEDSLPALTGCETPQNGDLTESDYGPCPLVVDPVHNVGWSSGNDTPPGGKPGNINKVTWVYDLETLAVTKGPAAPNHVNTLGAVTVPGRQRAYVPVFDHPERAHRDFYDVDPQPTGVEVGRVDCAVSYFDYERLDALRWGTQEYGSCSKFLNVNAVAAPEPGVVLLGGFSEEDRAARTFGWGIEILDSTDSSQGFQRENLGQPLLVRQVSDHGADGFQQDWELDLRYAGCGRRVQHARSNRPYLAFLDRVGDDLIAYCWDTKLVPWEGSAVVSGPQGYVVRIPLVDGHPVARAGAGRPATDANGAYVDYRAIRTPTLPGYLHVVADEQRRQLYLNTEGTVNGNSVWVFDIDEDRFVGVVSGGATAQPPGNQAVGFDPLRGRMYMLTLDGILRAPMQRRPLPAGQVFPVAANPGAPDGKPMANWANYPGIEMAPSLRRLFLPLNFPDQQRPSPPNVDVVSEKGARFLVVDDTSVDPPVLPPPDPDSNTTQVDEEANVEISARAEGNASGAHVVVTGGVVRTVDSVDPGCRIFFPATFVTLDVSLERSFFPNGKCAADQVVTPGHREFSLAAASTEAGSGSVAGAAPLAFDENDVTDRDLKRAGDCEIGFFNTLARGNISEEDQEDFGEGCDAFWDFGTGRGASASGHPSDPRNDLPDPRAGSTGRDGRGTGLPAASCSDFGGSPGEDGAERGPFSSAHAACDKSTTAASADASAQGLSISSEGESLVSVARVSSSVTTGRTGEGQVTVSAAKAEGVVVGPLSIREIRSVAVARAKGRTGTAAVEFERRWCGVTLDGRDPLPTTTTTTPFPPVAATGCIDPTSQENAEFLETLNQVLPRTRLSVTDANGEDGEGEASPGGYQAVLIKHPDARGGDLAVNDDDSHTVAGLEVTIYNDSGEGRNRYVVQLAGVHAESRYGITELPDFTGFDGFFGFFQEPTFTPGTPGTPGFTIPGASDLVEGETFETVIITRGRPGVGATDPIDNLLQWVPEAVKDLLRLLVQHPLEFLLLFGVFSVFATPAYMAYRRRTFLGVVTT